MDQLFLAKIQNTINEIENQFNKDSIDHSVAKILMQRSVFQIQELLTHIGYLEHKLNDNSLKD